ncbi:sigma-70 family RNA polymerase sigma factor [Corallococcus sp. CA049B]|nr:sigma-70 family RNA polymerase sigma factor [Corallococcus sp. CA049B]
MMSHDPTATLDVFMTFMGPLVRALERNPGCSHDDANDSAIDAVLHYRDNPGLYEEQKSSLVTFLTFIARRKAQDRFRSASARTRREQDPRAFVELLPSAPNVSLEERVDLKRTVERIEGAGLAERDLACIRLLLLGVRSTEQLAEALNLPPLSLEEMRREVKRHTDRLKKRLKSLCKEDTDDES